MRAGPGRARVKLAAAIAGATWLARADDTGVWLAGVVAGIGALGWLARRIYRWAHRLARMVETVHDLASYELTPNGGGSIKDRVGRLADADERTAEAINAIVDRVERLETVVAAYTGEQKQMWGAIEAVARATPPED